MIRFLAILGCSLAVSIPLSQAIEKAFAPNPLRYALCFAIGFVASWASARVIDWAENRT